MNINRIKWVIRLHTLFRYKIDAVLLFAWNNNKADKLTGKYMYTILNCIEEHIRGDD